MKKLIVVFLLVFVISSCTNTEESYTLEILPVAKVEMQTAFARDSVTEIPVKYIRPSKCYFFEDFYYQKNDFTRVVAIYNAHLSRNDCQVVENDTVVVPLKFKPTEIGTYTFKFWKGTNTSGQEDFFEYEVVVDH